MPSRAHLFINPTAGRGRAGKRLPRIVDLLQTDGVDVDVVESRAVGDLENQVAARTDISNIVVAGGDGSVHEAVNGILNGGGSGALSVIPTGTGNDYAKAIGTPLDWELATRELASRLAGNSTTRKIDAGRMNGRWFANGAGIGFDAKVTQIARSYHLPIGDFVYLLAIFRGMVDGIATPRITIEGDFEWDGPLTLASVSNGPWIGGKFHIAPMAVNDDSQLELLIAAPVTRRRIVALLPKLMKGSHIHEPEVSHAPVRSLRIRSDAPIPSHLDGEMQPVQTDFDIELVPDALQIL